MDCRITLAAQTLAKEWGFLRVGNFGIPVTGLDPRAGNRIASRREAAWRGGLGVIVINARCNEVDSLVVHEVPLTSVRGKSQIYRIV